MKIQEKMVVELTYELEVEGKVIESVAEEQPFDYIHGTHMLIPKFEEAVEGKEAGDSFEFCVTPEEGYGPYNPDRVITLPKEAFTINGEVREDLLVIGRFIPMLNQNGDVEQAMVAEVRENEVVMDFNPPMAGKTLNFTGKILTVREATEKELKEGLHGEFLPKEEHHCCHGRGGCHGHGHEEGHECHCHGEGHEHGEGGCCGGHGHEEGHECHCKHHEE